ncbi:MAG: hypothetical protein AAGJ52_13275 [Pseudomonadota bacterium]
MNTITESSVISRVNAGLSAGQGTTESSGVSMVGFHSVTFLANLAAVVAGGTATLSVQGRNEDSESWSDLDGNVSRTEAGVIALEVTVPTFAQFRAKLVRSDQNVTTGDVLAIRSKSLGVPVVDPSQSVAVLVSPEAAA